MINLGAMFDPDANVRTTTDDGQVLTYYEVARAGLGPMLLGIFDGGRIEEFLEGATLDSQDMTKLDILGNIGRKLAKFHALQIPVDRTPLDCIAAAQHCIKPFLANDTLKAALAGGPLEKPLDTAIAFDVAKEAQFCRSIRDKLPLLTVFCHW